MQMGVVIGLSIFLGIVGLFLVYSLRSVLDSSDASSIDELPSDQKNN